MGDFSYLLDDLAQVTGDKSYLKKKPVGTLSRDEDLAVRTIIGEAKGEGRKGWEGVADVIRTRAKQSGKSFGEVVLAPNQFEPWSSRKKELESYDPNSSTYQRIAEATLPVLRGERKGPAGDATHFYSPSSQAALGRKPPSWDNGKGVDIGNHRFFNLGYGGGGKHGITPKVTQAKGSDYSYLQNDLDEIIGKGGPSTNFANEDIASIGITPPAPSANAKAFLAPSGDVVPVPNGQPVSPLAQVDASKLFGGNARVSPKIVPVQVPGKAEYIVDSLETDPRPTASVAVPPILPPARPDTPVVRKLQRKADTGGRVDTEHINYDDPNVKAALAAQAADPNAQLVTQGGDVDRPPSTDSPTNISAIEVDLSDKPATKTYKEWVNDKTATALSQKTGVDYNIVRDVLDQFKVSNASSQVDEDYYAQLAKEGQGNRVEVQPDVLNAIQAAGKRDKEYKAKVQQYKESVPNGGDQSPLAPEMYAAMDMGSDKEGIAQKLQTENDAYQEWLKATGFDDPQYRADHSQEFEKEKENAITQGGFASLQKQKHEVDTYYADKPWLKIASYLPSLMGNETLAKDTAIRRSYDKTNRLSDVEINNAKAFGEGIKSYLNVRGNPASAATTGLGLGLGADVLNLASGTLRIAAPILDWATGGNASNWLDRAADQTRLAGEKGIPDRSENALAFEAGQGAGQAPAIIGTTILAGGNPVIGFAIHSALTNTGKPLEQQTTSVINDAVMGAVFESLPILDGLGGKTLDNVLTKLGFDAGAKDELGAMTAKARAAKIIDALFEKGKRVGTVAGIGSAQAATQDVPGETPQQKRNRVLKAGALYAVQELGMGAFGKEPTETDLAKLDGKVIRVPDEEGNPTDLVFRDGEIAETKAPDEILQAVIAPKDAAKAVVDSGGDEVRKRLAKPNIKPNEAKIPEPPVSVDEKPLAQTEQAKVPDEVPVKTETTTTETNSKEPWQMTRAEVVKEAEAVRTKRDDNHPVLVIDKVTGQPVAEIKQSQVGSLNADKYEPRNIGGGKYTPVNSAARDAGWIENVEQRHRQEVEVAISEGKTVPPDVLADYPDLQERAERQAKESKKVNSGFAKAKAARKDFEITGETGTKGIGVARLKELRDVANRKAESNPVTGLPNKAAFEKARPRVDADAAQEVTSIDLNNFKQVNDKNSHIVGDQALKDAADALQTAAKEISPQAQVFHLSGDEFAITSPKGTGKQILDAADKDFGNKKYGEAETSIGGHTAPTYEEAESGLQSAKTARKNATQNAEGTDAGRTAGNDTDTGRRPAGEGDREGKGTAGEAEKGGVKPPPEPKSEPPKGKPSRVGKDIEAKAITADLTKGFEGTAEYDPTTFKEQGEKVANLIATDPERARNIVTGAERLPADIRGAAFITGMERYARETGDIELLQDLAKSPLVSETSVHAQELGLLRERMPNSPVKLIQDVQMARQRAAKQRSKKLTVEQVVAGIKEDVRKTTAKRPKDWSAFVETLKCT